MAEKNKGDINVGRFFDLESNRLIKCNRINIDNLNIYETKEKLGSDTKCFDLTGKNEIDGVRESNAKC